MRLSTTGAFVRAARSARFANARICLNPPLIVVGIRHNSNEASWKLDSAVSDRPASTTQEGDLHNKSLQQEVVPNKDRDDEDRGRASFRDSIKNQERTEKIIRQPGLRGVKISDRAHIFDETSNVSSTILDLVNRNLYRQPNHPICITRKLIESVFPEPEYKNHIASDPVVTTHDNFDVLGFPKDHPGRSRTDTYYIDSTNVLRTHTSAHQHTAFKHMSTHKEQGFTICADVFRRDSIDRSHFPVFHQMEGARLWALPQNDQNSSLANHNTRVEQLRSDLQKVPKTDLEIVSDASAFDYKTNPPQNEHDSTEVHLMVHHLKRSLELLVHRVFTAAQQAENFMVKTTKSTPKPNPEPLKIRWVEAYFPFTSPSFELEVFWQGEWLELLGCGIVQQPILNNADLRGHAGWAWGIGIERLAMLLFGIPDIRLFWSSDKRFLRQFEAGQVRKFKPFSKYPACYKDISFWLPTTSPAAASPIMNNNNSSSSGNNAGVAAAAGGDATKATPAETQPAAFHENDLMQIVRDVAGNVAEDVKLVDEFVQKETGRKSLCYRINYRSLEKTLTNTEANAMHRKIEKLLVERLHVDARL